MQRLAWTEVALAMRVDPSHLVRLRPVHGSASVVATSTIEVDARLPDADIALTDRPDLALAVQAADCVPLFIADTTDRPLGPRGFARAVAAAHAGWRGLAGRVPARTVEALGREYGCRPENLIAVIGPSIGSCCYEVGLDVRDAFAGAGFGPDDLDQWFSTSPVRRASNPPLADLPPVPRAGHWFFDGWLAARQQLQAAGVPRHAIHCAELCTASHPKWLCSYRRDGSPAGRLAGAIRSRLRP